jgi:hypothetical protein
MSEHADSVPIRLRGRARLAETLPVVEGSEAKRAKPAKTKPVKSELVEAKPTVAQPAASSLAVTQPAAPAELRPIRKRADLPAVPLRGGAKPPGAKFRKGFLCVHICVMTKRPVLWLRLPCSCGANHHNYPWRMGWPVDAEIRSFQRTHCRKATKPVWLAIHPAGLDCGVERAKTAREAMKKWCEQWNAKTAEERKALDRREWAYWRERKRRCRSSGGAYQMGGTDDGDAYDK